MVRFQSEKSVPNGVGEVLPRHQENHAKKQLLKGKNLYEEANSQPMENPQAFD